MGKTKGRAHTRLGRHRARGEFKTVEQRFFLAVIAASASSSNAKRRRLKGGYSMIKRVEKATKSHIIVVSGPREGDV